MQSRHIKRNVTAHNRWRTQHANPIDLASLAMGLALTGLQHLDGGHI
jgi:hypothetical protein